MSKERVIHTWCDMHEQAKDEQVQGEEYTLAVNGVVTEIDLCSECAEPIAQLADWLRTYGREGASAPKRQGNGAQGASCPECGAPLKNRGSLSSHMRNQHGVGLKEYRRQRTAEAGAAAAAAGEGFTCPECGRVFATLQGRAAHLSRAAGHQGRVSA